MSDNLTITKEKVLAAASKCSTAAATLKVLFPEVFEDEKINLISKVGLNGYDTGVPNGYRDNRDTMVSIRSGGEYKDCSFALGSYFKWEIKVDEHGVSCLIPTRKK